MTETAQPIAGTLEVVVLRACQVVDCPHFQTRDCPEHASTEDLGIVAGWDNRKEAQNDGPG